MLASDYISTRIYKDNRAFFQQNYESHTFSNSVTLQVIWDRICICLCLAKKALTNIGQYGIISNNNLLRLGLLWLRFKGSSTVKMLNHLPFAELPEKASA